MVVLAPYSMYARGRTSRLGARPTRASTRAIPWSQAAQILCNRRRSYDHSTRTEQSHEAVERALRLVHAEAEFALASLAAHEAEALFLSLLASSALERRRRAEAQAPA